jgi:type II secretory pathway component PulF
MEFVQHPRKPPSVARETIDMRNTTERWMLIAGLLATLAIAAGVNLIVPYFDDVLRQFGAEIPWLTRMFVEGRLAFFGLPLIVLAAWALTPRRTPPGNERGIVALVIAIGLGVILLPAAVIAMYLPIFRMAGTVEG